jgi:MFS family permease
LFILAVPISCIYQFYFVHTSQFLGLFQSKAATEINRVFGVGGGGLMTIGQMSEMVILALMPFAAKRFSRKTLLATGVFAAALRMGLFAYVDQIQAHTGIPAVATLITGIAMHGICFGCFTFVAFMIVDEETTSDVRASAQSLFFLVSGGVGTIAGSVIASSVATWATSPDGSMDYTKLFSVPMWAAFICFVALLLFYPSGKQSSPNLASHDS